MAGTGKSIFGLLLKGMVGLYRATGGKVGGKTSGVPTLLLTTVGRKSGQIRTVPVMFLEVDSEYVVAGTNNGSDRHPGWYHNLRAKPEATIEVGRDAVDVIARFTEGEERDTLYQRFVGMQGRMARYEEKTDRVIPVIALSPKDGRDS